MVTYRLGNYFFSPGTKSLVVGDKEVVIEDKHNDILRCLVGKPGELVTKDELIDLVWGGRYTSDNNIAAKISELRKILNDSARNPRFIRTVHNKGYILISDTERCDQGPHSPLSSLDGTNQFPETDGDALIAINRTELRDSNDEEVTEDSQNPQPAIDPALVSSSEENATPSPNLTFVPRQHSLTVRNTVLPILIILIAATLAGYYFFLSPSHAKHFSYKTVTHNVGLEFGPALSPDGNYLAYSHANSINGPWSLIIKDLSTNQEHIVDAQEGHDLVSPLWSADGNALYFIRNQANSCTLMKARFNSDLTTSDHQAITDCGNVPSISPMSLSSDDTWLYYSYMDSKLAKLYIRKRNLLTEIESNVTTPSINYGGDYSHSLSPDNQKIVVHRGLSANQSELILINLISGERQLVDSFNSIKFSAVWSLDSRSFFYLNDDNALVEYNTEKQTYKYSPLNFSNPIFLSQATKESFFVVAGNYANYDIHKLDIIEEERITAGQPLIESSFNDYYAHADNERDLIVFISDRSGLSQIWQYKENSYTQLTHFQSETFLREPRLSSDGKLLAYILNGDLVVENLQESTITSVVSKAVLPESPEWQCGGTELYFSALDNENRHIYKFDFSSNEKSIFKRFSESIKADCKRNIYVTWSISNGLERLLPDEQTFSTILRDTKADFSDFDTYDGLIFSASDQALTTFDPDGKKAVSHPLSGASLRGLTVGKTGQYFILNKGGETAIHQLSPKVE